MMATAYPHKVTIQWLVSGISGQLNQATIRPPRRCIEFVRDGADILLEQLRHLRLGEPDGVIFQPDFNPRLVVLGLVKNQF